MYSSGTAETGAPLRPRYGTRCRWSAPWPRHDFQPWATPSRAGMGLQREKQQQRDQQRENAERFGHSEAENQVAELALRGRRVAHRGGEIVAEDDAHAGAGAAQAHAGKTCTNILRGNRIHETNSF